MDANEAMRELRRLLERTNPGSMAGKVLRETLVVIDSELERSEELRKQVQR